MRYGTSTAPKQLTNYERTLEGVLLSRNADSRPWWRCTAAARSRIDSRRPPASGSRVELLGVSAFDEARNPGEPSERELERERGLDAQLESAAVLQSMPGSLGDARAWLPRAHEWAHARLAQRLGEPFASVLAGELWGERSTLPPDLRAEFQETGTVHVLVTAGLHFGAVVAVALAVLSVFAFPRAVTCALAVACIWAFVWWSGGQLPAERAATMATTALFARACGRATFSWNTLAIAALGVALVRPESIATASFALSFSCVGAIFACAGPLDRWFDSQVAIPGRVREALVLSIATQLGTWPLGAAVFLQFTPYAILANLAIVPCVGATMALGAVQLALARVPPLAQAAANLDSWLLVWMVAVVRTLASLPGAAIAMTPAPAWCILAYDAALASAPYLVRRGAVGIAAGALALSALLVVAPPRAFEGRLRVTMLDVGQADAIVVQTPRGHDLLIDAGGRLERGPQGADSNAELVGERIVVPFLLRNGIHALDTLFVSHPHGDHAGGAAPVIRHLRVTRSPTADSGMAVMPIATPSPKRGRGASRSCTRERGCAGSRMTAFRSSSWDPHCRSSPARATTSTRTRSRFCCATERSACSLPATRALRRNGDSWPKAPTCAAPSSKSDITGPHIARRRRFWRQSVPNTRSFPSDAIICSAIRRPPRSRRSNALARRSIAPTKTAR